MSVVVDGRAIAEDIRRELVRAEGAQTLSLGVVMAADNSVTKKFVARKKEFGSSIHAAVTVHELVTTASTEEFVRAVEVSTRDNHGVVVQLPLPSGVDAKAVLNTIPAWKDVDVISDHAVQLFEEKASPVLPPVVGAIAEIITRHRVAVAGRRVAVIGSGRLVGRPAATWFRQQEANVAIVDGKTSSILEITKDADIVVLGAGSPGLLKPEMMKEGAVIFDAGTSETAGRLAGDADPACERKASLFTPVPGGIGPITVAMIFRNLLTLSVKT